MMYPFSPNLTLLTHSHSHVSNDNQKGTSHLKNVGNLEEVLGKLLNGILLRILNLNLRALDHILRLGGGTEVAVLSSSVFVCVCWWTVRMSESWAIRQLDSPESLAGVCVFVCLSDR